MSADVINLTDTSVVDDQVDGLTVVGNMEPVADILACSVYRKRLVCEGTADHQRNQLLREVVRAVVVGAAGDRHRKSVGSVVSENEKICACLGGRVRAGGVERCLLCEEEIRAVQRKISVDLIGGNLMVTLDPVGAACVKQRCGSHYVCADKALRIYNGTVNMALRCEVYNDIRFFFFEEVEYEFTVCDVALYELVVRLVLDRL